MTSTIRIGVSGWRYPPWRGTFYPPGVRQDDELRWASLLFGTLEINGSFYSLQRPASYAAWAEQTPDDFVFTLKANRFVTHIRRLREPASAMANFLASGLFELGPKLGPILWQLPPGLGYDPERIEAFLALLPHTTHAAADFAREHRDAFMKPRESLDPGPDRPLRHALEVRDASFETPEFMAQLRRHKVAAVIADTPKDWPKFDDVTAGFVYLRLHGTTELYQSRYTPEAIARWATSIDAWRRGAQKPGGKPLLKPPARAAERDVFCFFDNTDKVHAPDNASELITRLGVHKPQSSAR